MNGKSRLLLTGVALGATFGASTGVSPASDDLSRPEAGSAATPRLLTTAQFRGRTVTGVVQAVQTRRSRRIRLTASLHGLGPGRRYRVVLTTKPCRRDSIWNEPNHTGILDVPAQEAGDDVLATARVVRRGALRRVRSARIFDLGDPRRRQVACAVSGTYNSGTGVLT